MSQTIERTTSIERQDPNLEHPKKAKNRRPANTAFRQQRLKAWQPILTPKTVLPLFFAVGIIFAPIGGLLLWASSKVEEITIDYSNCEKAPTTGFEPIPQSRVTSHFKSSNVTTEPVKWMQSNIWVPYGGDANVSTRVCSLEFSIPNAIGPPVLFYYRLTDFYQNHRRYVKSMDTDQLMGKAVSNSSIDSGDCDPLQLDADGFAYYPCGLIANSLFNDTFFSPVLLNVQNSAQANVTYNMTDRGISWDSDRELYKPTEYTIYQVVPPVNWRARYPDGYTTENPLPNLHEMEAFQVWMRTAALPTFSKLALRNDTAPMAPGRYRVDIYDYFPVGIYGGTKSILISTRTVIGGRNPFLGIAYIIVGAVCVVLGALFTATHLIKPRKLGDHTYLSWNNDQPTTATASGRNIRASDAA